MKTTLARSFLMLHALVAACEEPPVARDEESSVSAQQSQQSDPMPMVSIQAVGNGCPAGSWTTSEKRDSGSVEVRLQEYRLQASPTLPELQTANCMIVARFTSARPMKMALRKVSFAGSATLREGMTAAFRVNYGRSTSELAANRPHTIPLMGPRGSAGSEEEVTFEDAIAEGSRTQCATVSDFLVDTSMMLVNPAPKKSGGISLHEVRTESGEIGLTVAATSQGCS